MSIQFEVTRTASAQTPLTCNCLLSQCAPKALATSHGVADSATSAVSVFHAASYELLAAPSLNPSTAGEEDGGSSGEARHVGDCAVYTAAVDADTQCSAIGPQCSTSQDGVPSLPGVFDLTSIPARFVEHLQPSCAASRYLVLACTDGGVRFVHPNTLVSIVPPFTHIHAEMITSCTPFCTGAPSGGRTLSHLLCSAHTGAVVLYALEERVVTQALEGHEFDAWCTAAVPTGGWWTAPAPHPCKSDADGDDGESGAGAYVGAPLLASGGDDGLLKLYDVRCGGRRAIARARFDAGVVSITPVLETASSDMDAATSAAVATPYLLAGSYDESIQLIDVRYMRRAVAQRGGMGGGVWRTSRCLYPLLGKNYHPPVAAAEEESGDATLQLMMESAVSSVTPGWVNTSNVLVLPLMQRGVVLLPYDVRAAADDVFGDDPLQHFFSEEDNGDAANVTALPTLTEKSLVYDAAVLRPLGTTGEEASAVVATTSFYEKRIDVWSVRPLRGGGRA